MIQDRLDPHHSFSAQWGGGDTPPQFISCDLADKTTREGWCPKAIGRMISHNRLQAPFSKFQRELVSADHRHLSPLLVAPPYAMNLSPPHFSSPLNGANMGVKGHNCCLWGA